MTSKLNKFFFRKSYFEEELNVSHTNVKIYIITSELIKSIAISIQKHLYELNIESEIKFELTYEDCINSTYNEIYLIINNTFNFDILPKRYIVYQLENSNIKNFSNKFITILSKAQYVWDYSMENYKMYDNIVHLNNFYYCMIPFNKNMVSYKYNEISEKVYDLCFYGERNNRIDNILNKLKEKYNVCILYGILDNEKYEIIKKSRIMINLHYFNQLSLEICYFNELLLLNKLIISELPTTNDSHNIEIYKEFVDFITMVDDNLSNISQLYEMIDKYLNDEKIYNDKIHYIYNHINKLHDISFFYIKKNLLPLIGNNSNLEYDLEKNSIYCLSLIETPYRKTEFLKQEYIPNVKYFPAIKYNPGWKGCGLSYQTLILNAKRCGLEQITICEDDCRFPKDFPNIYNNIQQFLKKIEGKWDMFVGCIADLPKGTKIKKVYSFKNMTFVEVDQFYSMVFNIYNKSCYDTVLEWDYKISDSNTNTIDQFLKEKNLRIITTYPFYFDCLCVKSTLWEKNLYEKYNILFNKSLNGLKELITTNYPSVKLP